MAIVREWELEGVLIGRRVLWHDSVDSTNRVAAGHAGDPANEGLVILADEQSAGRGRHGRRWQAPRASSLLLSILLQPPDHLRRPPLLTALAAVAVCETISAATQLQASIKWPNDVLVRGRKVCGVLVEQGRGTIIGIGLNVNTRPEDLPERPIYPAASLAMFTGRPLDREQLAVTLIRQLDQGYQELLGGHEGDLEARWRWHSGLLGRDVILRSQGTAHQGKLLELAFHGLLLQVDGELRQFSPELVEEVRLLG